MRNPRGGDRRDLDPRRGCDFREETAPAPGVTYLEAASRQLFGVGIGRANDDARLTTHADVLRCYDLAIALAEAAPERTEARACFHIIQAGVSHDDDRGGPGGKLYKLPF